MQVEYGGQNLGLTQLDLFEIEPAFDPSGQDLLFHDLSLAVTAALNPYATSTSKPPGLPFGGVMAAGDRMGISIDRLKDILSTPRQQLKVTVGGDVVIFSPSFVTTPGGVEPLAMDPRGGPYPGKCIIEDPIGDKTGKLRWSVKTTVSPCNSFLLSNRWGVRSRVDREGFTTRTITGKAIFRLDYLDFENLSADDFRPWLIVPCAPNLQRTEIEVTVTDDGGTLDYSCTDVEQSYGLTNRQITRIEGNVTIGSELSLKGVLAGAGEKLIPDGGFWEGFLTGPARLIKMTSVGGAALSAWAKGNIDLPKANGLVRIWGQRGIDKKKMVQTGIAVLMDRFQGLKLDGNLTCMSCYITQDISSNAASFIEVRMEFLALNRAAFKSLIDPASAGLMMDFTNVYNVGGGVLFNTQSPTPTFPNSRNTRGSFIGELAVAALKAAACTLPVPPADPGNATDTTGVF